MTINVNKFPVDVTVYISRSFSCLPYFARHSILNVIPHISRTKMFSSKFELYYKSILRPVTQRNHGKNNHMKARP